MAVALGISAASVPPLACRRFEATLRARLQGLAQPQVRRETRKHRGSVPVPTRARPGVLCCDEKSQVQALDRTQPGLPMKKGRAVTMTHGEQGDRKAPRSAMDHRVMRRPFSKPSGSTFVRSTASSWAVGGSVSSTCSGTSTEKPVFD